MSAADTTYLEKLKENMKELESEQEKYWEFRTGLMAYVWARVGGWGKVIAIKRDEEGTEYKQIEFEAGHVEWVESIDVYSIDEAEDLVQQGQKIEGWVEYSTDDASDDPTGFFCYDKEWEVQDWLEEEMERLQKEIKKAEKKEMARGSKKNMAQRSGNNMARRSGKKVGPSRIK
jgi:hypothetical protein